MHQIIKSHHPIRHIKSFKYAAKGVSHATLNEANFRVELAYTIFVIILGFILKLSAIEWALQIIVCTMLIGAEMVNTIIEEFIDHLIHEHHEGARVIKDLSAGFVLVTTFCVLIVTALIFLPKLVQLQL